MQNEKIRSRSPLAPLTDHTDQAQERAYILRDFERTERLLKSEKMQGKSGEYVGVEQEIQFVMEDGLAAPIADKISSALEGESYEHEFSRFTFEIILPPTEFSNNVLERVHSDLFHHLSRVRDASLSVNAQPVLISLLPSLRPSDLLSSAITQSPRYAVLQHVRSRLRGPRFNYSINGLDRFSLHGDDSLLAGAFTSLQLHWQIAPNTGAAEYNWAQLIAAPCLAAAAASPILLGRRLWHESRVPLFQQTSQLHSPEQDPFGQLPLRAELGPGWVSDTLAPWREDMARHPPILSANPTPHKNSPSSLSLPHLTLFNSTVYRWNRLCYGVDATGQPSLRIEARMLPSGPTLADELANAAFWWGLMAAGAEYGANLPKQMAFEQVGENFYRSSRDSLHCQIQWIDGRSYRASDLILNVLVPLALSGLNARGISDGLKWLTPLIKRVQKEISPAIWMLQRYTDLLQTEGRQSAGLTLTRDMIAHDSNYAAFHEWPEQSDNKNRGSSPALAPLENFDIPDRSPAIPAPDNLDRILINQDSGNPGPLLVIIAGIHGNELNGVESLRKFIERLNLQAGAVAGLLGNLPALQKNTRYLDEDMNRAFEDEAKYPPTEDRLQAMALWEELSTLKHSYPHRELWLIDLHGTSGHTPPYLSLLSDPNAWPINAPDLPTIVGFETIFRGTLVEKAVSEGWHAATLEAGALGAPITVENGLSCLLLLADKLGISPLPAAEAAPLQAALTAQSHVSGKFRFVARHELTEGNSFKMRPGFVSFQPIKKGDILADDRNGPISAPRSGLLLMPLYQAKGKHGFFIVDAIEG